ncbi:FadR family transcriptional regulator [Desulfovibrio sp. OttesenSCG-928-O18]|nr:FadR family transcriptional regulator [Desulfovibrio sp. OttesenSCG-928-O18]
MPVGSSRFPIRRSADMENGLNELRDRPKNLAQHIVDDIVERIRGNLLQSGAKLPTEAALMREFGVSRTVVREALSRLQAAGLVETRHGIGTFVLPPEGGRSPFQHHQMPVNLKDIIAVIELRISLETEAAALAALRATSEQIGNMRAILDDFAEQVEQQKMGIETDKAFHMEIARATGNKYFEEIFGYLGEIIPRARINTYRYSIEKNRAEFLRRTHLGHVAIFDAIATNDPESARAAMRVHLNGSRELLLKVLEAIEESGGDEEDIPVPDHT